MGPHAHRHLPQAACKWEATWLGLWRWGPKRFCQPYFQQLSQQTQELNTLWLEKKEAGVVAGREQQGAPRGQQGAPRGLAIHSLEPNLPSLSTYSRQLCVGQSLEIWGRPCI